MSQPRKSPGSDKPRAKSPGGDKLKFLSVPPGAIGMIWHVMRPGVARVLKHGLGLWTERDILEKCQAGEWLLFAVYDDGEPVVVLVAEMIEAPDEKHIFNVGMCWGARVDEWISDVCEAFETIAKQCGCDRLSFSGRPGWSRLAKQHNFNVNSITFSKELN